MKLKKGVPIPALLNAIQGCRADAIYVSEDGDSFDLKSALSSFVFTAVRSDASLSEGEIILKDPEDAIVLRDFLEDAPF